MCGQRASATSHRYGASTSMRSSDSLNGNEHCQHENRQSEHGPDDTPGRCRVRCDLSVGTFGSKHVNHPYICNECPTRIRGVYTSSSFSTMPGFDTSLLANIDFTAYVNTLEGNTSHFEESAASVGTAAFVINPEIS